MKILEADLSKHYSASKNLQSQIRKAEADVKAYELEAQKFSDENQVWFATFAASSFGEVLYPPRQWWV